MIFPECKETFSIRQKNPLPYLSNSDAIYAASVSVSLDPLELLQPINGNQTQTAK